MGDINIDSHNPKSNGYDLLNTLCETFNLKNIIKNKTCHKGIHASSIDAILTNRPRSFQNTSTYETVLSDYHYMITTFLKSHLVHRDYKHCDESSFLADIQAAKFTCNSDDPNLNYENLVNTFCSIINKHAPLKQKTLRGNEAPFMNKQLRKAIYTRSRLKNKYNKNRTDENSIQYKKQINKCVNLRKKAIKTYFKNITNSGIVENKTFWQTVKPFITNKSGITTLLALITPALSQRRSILRRPLFRQEQISTYHHLGPLLTPR